MALTIENHWHKEGGLWTDPDLLTLKKSPMNYRPSVFTLDDCIEDAVLTLRGPRRAGKTVALKLFIAELIEKHRWNAHSIAWLSFEGLRTLQQAEALFRSASERKGLRLLCIDEVTSVIGWQRALKKVKDEGLLRTCTVILTGSSAFDLKKGAERLAGRRGDIENPDRVLLPMSFADFSEQLKLGLQLISGTDCLRYFLTVGGFPFRVNAFLQCQKLGKDFDPFTQFQIFDDVFFYEVNRRRLDRNTAIELLGRLAQLGAGVISYEGLVKPLSLARETARRYLDVFGDAFLLATISTFDTSRNRVAPKKDRKFIWVDPALGLFAQWLDAAPAVSEPHRVEMAVGAELLRRHEKRLFEGLSAPRSIFTWKSSSGNEVDFLVVHRSAGKREPVEIKYQDSISDWDFQVIERAFGCGTLVTKNESRKREKSQALSVQDFLLK